MVVDRTALAASPADGQNVVHLAFVDEVPQVAVFPEPHELRHVVQRDFELLHSLAQLGDGCTSGQPIEVANERL